MSQDLNYYNKPLFNLSWYYLPSEKLSVSTVAYLSIGTGGGTNYSGTVTRDTLTGQQNLETVYNSNSTTIDAIYSSTEHKATRVLLSSMNNHIWIGALSTATYKPTDHLAYLLGIDLRYYKGSHYRTVYDLIGGDYYVEPTMSNQSQPRGTFLVIPTSNFTKNKLAIKLDIGMKVLLTGVDFLARWNIQKIIGVHFLQHRDHCPNTKELIISRNRILFFLIQ